MDETKESERRSGAQPDPELPANRQQAAAPASDTNAGGTGVDSVAGGGAPDSDAKERAGSANTEGAETSDEDEGDGDTTHHLNTEQVSELIDQAKTADDLQALETSERAHPTYQGGRVAVMDAIARRRAALDADKL